MSLAAIYSAVVTLAAPGLRWMLARRVVAGKEIAGRLGERFGVEAALRPGGRVLWVHAASVGETVSVLPVLAAVAGLAPDVAVLMTTGTVTSARLLEQRLPAMGLAGVVRHRFVPLDVPAWAGRFLDHWRPDAAAFVESEIWPSLIGGCVRRGIPLALVNARLSERSFRGWRRVPGLARGLFGAFDRVQAQSEADGGRIAALGGAAAVLTGNLKLAAPELPVDEGELARLRGQLGGRPVWLAASTHPGEDAVVIEAHARLLGAFPELLTVIVPRHPERGAEIVGLACGLVTRRGAGEDPPGRAGVYVADTLGELGLFYRLAGVAFVGKSIGGVEGGQNPLEPARLGCAVAMGPAVQNFADIVAELEAAGGLERVRDAGSLAEWVGEMLREPGRRAAMGAAGRRVASGAAGLPGEVAAMLVGMLG